MHKIVIHAKNQAISTGIENLAELKTRLHLSYAYTEILGETTYDHYDCWGVKRGK